MSSKAVDVENDIFAVVGYWEPIAFMVRGGRAYRNLENDEYPYSEQMAQKLSQIGINAVIWHYYKGLGIENERKEMEKTAQFFKHCEKYNLRKGVYMNGGSVFADTFIAENPDAEKWIAVDQWGMKHQYSEFYRCYYRWRPCSSHEQFAEYVSRAAMKAIEDGADYIQFDNSAQMPCYCDKCKKDFPQYLIEKYPAKTDGDKISFKQRFGYEFQGRFELPRGTARQPIDNMPAATDAGFYEWVRWRQRLYEKTLDTVCRKIHEARPDSVIGWNIALDYGEFPGLVWGLDPESSLRVGTDMFFSEDENYAGLEDGRLIGHIRTYKYGRAMKNRVLVHNIPGDDRKEIKLLNYAEAAVFNDGCLGRVMWAQDVDDNRMHFLRDVLAFLRSHKEIYIKAKSMSRAAVYRCAESEAANWADAMLSRLTVEQSLIKNSIQYDHIINDRMEELDRYEVLICANTVTVSDAVVHRIAGFVRKGGKVVCTEMSFASDPYNRKRKFAADMGLKGERDADLGRAGGRTNKGQILEYLGLEDEYAASIYYVPKIQYRKPFIWDPRSSHTPVIGKDYFDEALNKEVIVSMIREALGDCDLQLDAPENVIAGMFETHSGKKVVHILDYQADRELNGVALTIKNNSKNNKKVKFVSFETERELDAKAEGDGVKVLLPIFKTYGFVIF